MAKYASTTEVAPERSRDEIQATLRRYGATRFGYLDNGDSAAIAFEIAGRRVRFVIALPDRDDESITHYRHNSGNLLRRAASAVEERWQQAVRQRWRALALVVKAKLEAVDAGIMTIEDAFLANIVLPTGRTVAEEVRPRLAQIYDDGVSVPLLPPC